MDLHGPGKVDLHGASLLQDRPISAAASVYISREGCEPPNIFQHQSTGYLRTRGQETLCETCTNLQLRVHYYSAPWSAILCYIRREPQSLRTTRHFFTGYPSTKGQETS